MRRESTLRNNGIRLGYIIAVEQCIYDVLHRIAQEHGKKHQQANISSSNHNNNNNNTSNAQNPINFQHHHQIESGKDSLSLIHTSQTNTSTARHRITFLPCHYHPLRLNGFCSFFFLFLFLFLFLFCFYFSFTFSISSPLHRI